MSPLSFIATALAFTTQQPEQRQLMYAASNTLTQAGPSQPRGYHHPHIDQCVTAIDQLNPQGNIYHDWFTNFLYTLQENLQKREQAHTPEALKQLTMHAAKDLNEALRRYQQNSSLYIDDCQSLSTQTSPLASRHYIRDERQPLRLAASHVARTAVNQKLSQKQLAIPEQMQSIALAPKQSAQANNKLLAINVKIINSVESITSDDLSAMAPLYIKSTQLLLVHQDDMQAKAMEASSHGLLQPIAVSANICAHHLAMHIAQKNIPAIKAFIHKAMEIAEIPDNIIQRLDQIEFDLTPTLQTNQDDRRHQELQANYESLQSHPNDPTFLKTSIDSIHNLAGNNINAVIPKTIKRRHIADATSKIKKMQRLAEKIRQSGNTCSPMMTSKVAQETQYLHHFLRSNMLLEQGSNFAKSFEHLLSSSTPAIASYCDSHLNSLFTNIEASLNDEDCNLAISDAAYFETEKIFYLVEDEEAGIEETMFMQKESNPQLREKDIIIIEPHPNNADKRWATSQDPCQLLKTLYSVKNPREHTIIADITNNHPQDTDIQNFLQKAQQYINNGSLNLIIATSASKLFSLGTDIASGGIVTIFNNNSEKWQKFNQAMQEKTYFLQSQDQQYFAKMLDNNAQILHEKINKCRSNAQYLKGLLLVGFKQANAFSLHHLEDDQTPILSFSVDKEYLYQVLRLKNKRMKTRHIRNKEVEQANDKIINYYLFQAFERENLPVRIRNSFGYLVTSITFCGNGIRIVTGTEELAHIEQYAHTLVTLGQTLYQHPENFYNNSRPSSPTNSTSSIGS